MKLFARDYEQEEMGSFRDAFWMDKNVCKWFGMVNNASQFSEWVP